MHAYDESYLDDALDNLGAMLDYAVCDCNFDANEFFDWFIISGVAKGFETGNPRYIAGMSGQELASEVCFRVLNERPSAEPTQALDKSPEYWAGWAMAYYQWFRGLRFDQIKQAGITPEVVMQSYILHEADISKFVAWGDARLQSFEEESSSSLARLRKLRGLTQAELAERSGVTLRMVQLYEQGHNNLAKASAETVLNLAQAIGCKPKDLIGA